MSLGQRLKLHVLDDRFMGQNVEILGYQVNTQPYHLINSKLLQKTIGFSNTIGRSPSPMMSISLPERCYCADVDYPMAIVGTAGRGLIVYSLENKPTEFKRNESPLKFQHRAVSIFRDKKKTPTGYALGSIEGRVAIQYVSSKRSEKWKKSFKINMHIFFFR